MAKTYLCEDGAGQEIYTSGTSASGAVKHWLRVGAVNGHTIVGYSGQVNGTTIFYEVDNGPSFGRGISAT